MIRSLVQQLLKNYQIYEFAVIWFEVRIFCMFVYLFKYYYIMKFNALILLFFIELYNINAQNLWRAPQEFKQLQNPLRDRISAIQKGQKIYKSLCASCHGDNGTGNPVMIKTLNPPPADLTTGLVQQQTDGEIFWKITEGRGLMASYKNMLSDEERWAVVSYIRKIEKKQTVVKQDNSTEKTNEVESFSFSQLINAKTTFIRQTKGFGFNIQHRFGAAKFDKNLIRNFLGLDLASNVRFSFEIPVSKRFMFEIGRTRYGKFYDLGTKYLLIKQTRNNRKPISVAFYENIALTTENAPQYSKHATFEDGRQFEYKFYHRLFYDTQLIVSRKFNDKLSGQIAVEFVWRNLTPYIKHPEEKAYVIAFPVSLRYKIGLTSAIDLEVMPNSHHKTMPISLAYEIASSGNHVFQITITNSDRILSQNMFFTPTLCYPKEGFMLGFNLVRYF